MSQTYSQKRSRTMSQLTDKSISQTRSFFVAPSALTKVGPKREVAGAGVQKAQSVGAKRSLKKPSIRDLLDTVFPRVHYKSFNYGYNLYSMASLTGLKMSGTLLDSKGDCKALRCQNCEQAWFESIALPLYHYKLGTANQLNASVPSVRSLQELMIAATSAVNYGKSGGTQNEALSSQLYPSGTLEYNNLVSTATASANPTMQTTAGDVIPEPNLYEKAPFHYEGGHQRHVFKNVGNNQVWIELWELHPRNPMIDWQFQEEDTGQDLLYYRSVGDIVIEDFKANAQRVQTSFTFPTGMANSSLAHDACNDPLVRISEKCHTVNNLFKVSKPIRVGLAPGETFQYTMYIPGFTFSNTEFMEHIKILGSSAVNQVKEYWTRPTSVPKFTKRLVCRAWGEMGHTDISANQTSQPGTTGLTGVTLLHTQEEQHKFRFMPLTNKDYTILRYERDDTVGGGVNPFYIMNDESDTNALLDV